MSKIADEFENLKDIINQKYPNCDLEIPSCIDDLSRGIYMVYILTFDDGNGSAGPIVVGHGRYNRVRIIFDEEERVTTNHFKAFLVRAYKLFGKGTYRRYIIECDSKAEAQEIETYLHGRIGGNEKFLPNNIKTALFKDSFDPLVLMVLKMAWHSSYDGLSDLRSWKAKNVIDKEWSAIAAHLKLKEPRPVKTK